LDTLLNNLDVLRTIAIKHILFYITVHPKFRAGQEGIYFEAALRPTFYACVYCMQLQFQRNCLFKEIAFVSSNKGNYLENATACSKHMLKTRVTTQLKFLSRQQKGYGCLLVVLLNWCVELQILIKKIVSS